MENMTLQQAESQSADLIKENIDQLKQIFPEVIKEGRVDFEALNDLLGNYADTAEERFCLNWAGKANARREAQKRSTGTLRPCPEDSVDWENTQNIYIEGDNLEVLKLLQKSYHNKVKMIYIDPPYNTGKDFVYKDNYTDNMANYLELTGQDKKLSTNTESDGRYHSNWLNMMYPRLKLARNLLTDDGVIFISIDDNEQADLKGICDEIYGADNFIAQIIWERAFAPINLMKHFSPSHDYILCYSKNIDMSICKGIPRTSDADDRYSNQDNDPRGVWSSSDISVGPRIEEKTYPITTPSGRIVEPPAGRCWRLSRNAFLERLQDNRIWFGANGDGVPRIKRFLSELKKEGITPMTLWKYEDVGHSQDATQKLAQLFEGKKFFDYPKPIGLIKRCIELYTDTDSIVLDFFSGSATTAHAVMEMNVNSESNRKFIMVQLPEIVADNIVNEAGYTNLCEIAKERIRRAGNKILEEQKAQNEGLFAEEAKKLDVGFKVFKLDSSNINAWDNSPENIENALQNSLFNIKSDRSEDDLLYEILIKYGIELTEKINCHEIAGKTVFEMGAGSLIVCLADNLTIDVAEGIGKLWNEVRPEGADVKCRVVFKDSGFNASDEIKTNTMLILKQHGITNVASV